MLKEFELQIPVNIHSEIMMGVSHNGKLVWKIVLNRVLYKKMDLALAGVAQ